MNQGTSDLAEREPSPNARKARRLWIPGRARAAHARHPLFEASMQPPPGGSRLFIPKPAIPTESTEPAMIGDRA